MTSPHDTPEAVEAMCRSLDQAAYLRPASHSIAAMLRRLHARAVAAEAAFSIAALDANHTAFKLRDAQGCLANLEGALATARTEIAAREAAAWCAGRDAAADYVDECLAALGAPFGTASVRALTPPPDFAAALEAVRREERERMGDAPREVAMGHGLVDVGVVNHEGRYGLRIKPRGHYVPVGEKTAAPGSLMEIASGGGVLIWLDGPEFGDTIVNALNEAAAIRARGTEGQA